MSSNFLQCYFYEPRLGCTCLTVTSCPVREGGKCSFYKTKDEYIEGQRRSVEILRKKGLQPAGHTVQPIVEQEEHN